MPDRCDAHECHPTAARPIATQPVTPSVLCTLYFVLCTSLMVSAFYPRAETTEDLPGDRPDGGGHFTGTDLVISLTADDHDLVAGRDVQSGDVHDHHVHADRPDDGHS